MFGIAGDGVAVAFDVDEDDDGVFELAGREDLVEAFLALVFADFLYKETLDSSRLDIDQLITCYILIDYVACPKVADLVFQQIHMRTHNATFLYSAKQVDYILSNILAVQPLRPVLFDQVRRGILMGKYDLTTSKDAEKILEPHMVDLLGAVTWTNAETSKPSLLSGMGKPDSGSRTFEPMAAEKQATTRKSNADLSHIGFLRDSCAQ